MKKYITLSLLFIAALVLKSCTLNNVKVDNELKKYFEQNDLKGSFAILDNAHEVFNIYDLSRYRDSSYAPGGTFEILSTMLAIETGRVNDQNALIKIPNDTAAAISLNQAFKISSHPVYAYISQKIGKDTLQFWLDSLHYGKAKIMDNAEPFWVNDSLKLTPDEQLGFIAKVYFESLPFQKRTQSIMHKMLVKEENTLYTLAFKKSWHQNTKGQLIGWVTGWIEENKHVYFFVHNATSINQQPTTGSLEKTMREILTNYGFFKGKK